MSAQFYVKRALRDIAPLRARLRALGAAVQLDQKADVASIADLAGNCELLYIPALTEQRAVDVLQQRYGVDTSSMRPSSAPLAGALCVGATGLHRWILVNADDSDKRQRFTIAHELGHLFMEVEPELERARASLPSFLPDSEEDARLLLFSRCAVTEPSESLPTVVPASGSRPLSAADRREIEAHHFASELLMPYEGVKQLIQRLYGVKGLSRDEEFGQLARDVADHFDVSLAAARLRVEKDLALKRVQENPNRELFQ